MKHWIIENKEWIAGSIATLSAWFGGRKLKKTNEKSAELENLKTLREIEKEVVTETRNYVDELMEIIKNKDKIIEEQKKIISRQREQLQKCKVSCNIDS
ncbi:MAG: hypothetical protein N4A45_10270 [Flavobacteriales bacterium]|jgi:hypothetical protein|nr:hypothetical protein [Flavobacteriales bacterium]